MAEKSLVGRSFLIMSKMRSSLFSDPVRRLRITLLVLLSLVIVGSSYYWIAEAMSPADALYMTVISLTTVGLGEPQILSPQGRLFTVIFISFGVVTAGYAIKAVLDSVTSDELWLTRERKRMRKVIMNIENHYILCGIGRTGRQVQKQLQRRNMKFLIVDVDETREEEFLIQGWPYVIGDATSDETLEMANIQEARGLVSALNSDAANIATVLTARGLNEDLFIVARAAQAESDKKLRRAGADRVVSPYHVGGHSMALALLNPVVHDFVNRMTGSDETEIGQVHVLENSPLAGQTIGACDLRRISGITILAIQRGDGGGLTVNPSVDYSLKMGDTLVVIGPSEAILRMERQGLWPIADIQDGR